MIIPRAWPTGFVVWVFIVSVGLYLMVRWHARSTGYRCRNCGNEFEISTFTDLVSPHGTGDGGWTYLKCPRCEKRTRAKVLRKE